MEAVSATPMVAAARRRALLPRGAGKLIVLYVLLMMGAVCFSVPFLWMVSTALKPISEVFAQPPSFVPHSVRFDNFVKAWTVAPFTQFLGNTVFITVGSVLGAILTSSLVAFSFSRLRWAGRDFWFMVMLSTIMLPSAVTLIPTFILFKNLGWVNTFAPLMVPPWLGGSAFNIFLLRQFFRSIPKELDEAAVMDGASSLWIYWKVILPLSRPAIGAIGVFSFIFHWNDFLGPLIYLNKQHLFTLSLGLNLLQGSSEFNGQVISWNYLMADSVAVMLPCIILFFLFQRYFIRGVSLAGVQR